MAKRHGAYLSRRQWMRMLSFGAAASPWMPHLTQLAAAAEDKPRRHCVLLWMSGGPSQIDTFDMKPNHENGGEFKEASTNVPGLRISEHLPRLAQQADQLAVIRSLSTSEGDHNRGTFLMHTGHRPGGPIQYPTMGASLSKAMESDGSDELPRFISISPFSNFSPAAYSPGFLGPQFAPLTVGSIQGYQPQQQNQTYAQLGVDDLRDPSVDESQREARLDLWTTLQREFLANHAGASATTHHTVYQRAVEMMNSEAAAAFDLSKEPDRVRDAYGRGRFGQGCLMARRLIERGVPFIEVALRGGQNALGWDTHNQNFSRVKSLSEELDAGWAALMQELKERGLLELTTIIWLGEFGRTPKINRNGGRDHYPKAWTSVLAGGGVRGGQAFGATSEDGREVVEGKVDVPDLLATLCQTVGVDPQMQNISELGRPIRVAEGRVIQSLVEG